MEFHVDIVQNIRFGNVDHFIPGRVDHIVLLIIRTDLHIQIPKIIFRFRRLAFFSIISSQIFDRLILACSQCFITGIQEQIHPSCLDLHALRFRCEISAEGVAQSQKIGVGIQFLFLFLVKQGRIHSE